VLIGTETAPVISNNSITTGQGGLAGTGGAGGLAGEAGRNGTSSGGAGGTSWVLEGAGAAGTGGQGGFNYGIFDDNPKDDAVPEISGNTMNVGTAGSGRAINGTPGSSGETNF
jgi:hypothetical protein